MGGCRLCAWSPSKTVQTGKADLLLIYVVFATTPKNEIPEQHIKATVLDEYDSHFFDQMNLAYKDRQCN